MGKKYTDKWLCERERDDPLDWCGDECWEYWEAEYEWIRCDSDFEEQDIVAFKDDVCIENRKGARTWYDAERFIIARVAQIERGRSYFQVIHSEGRDAFEPEDKFSRKTERVARYGLYRWPRDGSPRDNRTFAQIEKADFLKEARKQAKLWHESGGTVGEPGEATPTYNSKFVSAGEGAEKSAHSSKSSWSKPPTNLRP